jgi:hypothetical protein
MKKTSLFIIAILLVMQANAQTAIFNSLLQEHVTEAGTVNYKGFKNNEAQLDNYLSYLETTSPDNSWSENKQKAFWINAYNAYTLKIILKNYPLKSITDIKEKERPHGKFLLLKLAEKRIP